MINNNNKTIIIIIIKLNLNNFYNFISDNIYFILDNLFILKNI